MDELFKMRTPIKSESTESSPFHWMAHNVKSCSRCDCRKRLCESFIEWNPKIINELYGYQADSDQIMRAINDRDMLFLHFLLDNEIPIDFNKISPSYSSTGLTYLMTMFNAFTQSGDQNYEKLLIKLMEHPGIDIRARDSEGHSTVSYITKTKNAQFLISILKRKDTPSFNIGNSLKRYMLQVDWNATVETESHQGQTAFMLLMDQLRACRDEHVVRLLCDLISRELVDLRQKDHSGKSTTLYIANTTNGRLFKALIESHSFNTEMIGENTDFIRTMIDWNTVTEDEHDQTVTYFMMLFRKYGTSIDRAVLTFLQQLAKCGNIDINITDDHGHSAVYYIAQTGNADLFKCIIQRDDFIQQVKNEQGLKFLRQFDCNSTPSCSTDVKRTYFMLMLQELDAFGGSDVTRLLRQAIQSKAFNINQRDEFGYSVVYYLAKFNNNDVFRCLSEHKDFADHVRAKAGHLLAQLDGCAVTSEIVFLIKHCACPVLRPHLQRHRANTYNESRDTANFDIGNIINNATNNRLFGDVPNGQRQDLTQSLSRESHIARDVSFSNNQRYSSSAMSVIHRAALIRCRVYICRDLIIDKIFDHLIQESILDSDMVDEIKQKTLGVRNKMCSELLDVLPLRGNNAFRVFCDALRESSQGHVASILETRMS